MKLSIALQNTGDAALTISGGRSIKSIFLSLGQRLAGWRKLPHITVPQILRHLSASDICIFIVTDIYQLPIQHLSIPISRSKSFDKHTPIMVDQKSLKHDFSSYCRLFFNLT